MAFPVYHATAPRHMKELVCRQTPWVDLHCPECGDRDKPITESKFLPTSLMCWDRLSGPFPCKGCDRLFALESLAQPDWPFDDSSSQSREAMAKATGPVIRIKPRVPFRLGPFVWRQNNPDFRSHHWELVKVIPALLILYGLKHFSVLPQWVNWDLVFWIVFVYLSIDLFILRNEWFRTSFALPFEKWWLEAKIAQHLPNWMRGIPGIRWQDRAIWLILAVLGILFFLLLGPEAFDIMSGQFSPYVSP